MAILLRVLLGLAVSLDILVYPSAVSGIELTQIALQAVKPPSAPTGYKWYVSKNSIGSFLRPDGWFVKEEVNKNTNALFITKHDFAPSEKFDIGLTVNQINNFSRQYSIMPSEYARKFIAKLTINKEIIKFGTVKGNSRDMNIARVRGSIHGVSTIVHYITIGDNENDIVYLLLFEAPEKDWD